MTGRSMPRFFAYLMVFALVLLSGPGVSANQATPQATPISGETRLFLDQDVGLTAQIPVEWVPDRSLQYDYALRGQGIQVRRADFYTPPVLNLDELCKTAAGENPNESIEIEGRSGCVIENPNLWGNSTLILQGTPNSSRILASYIAVEIDGYHFQDVIKTISFDLSDISAAQALDATVDWMSVNALYRDALNWEDSRSRAHEVLGPSGDINRLFIAVQSVLIDYRAVAKGGHMWVWQSSIDEVFRGPYISPSSDSLAGNVGYLNVPGFIASLPEGEQFTSTLRSDIALRSDDAACGWIVDLRGNTGGDMTPMLAGLAPLLGAGPVVGFQDPNGNGYQVALDQNGNLSEGYQQFPATELDSALAKQPIAVLIGPYNGSAGEATAIGLINRDNTRFFGQTTAGAATAPDVMTLLDGSTLTIGVVWMTGPQGAIYPDGIQPDVIVGDGIPTLALEANDPTIVAATEWLHQQPGCAPTIATPAA